MNKLNDTLNLIKYSDLEKFKNNALKSMIDNDWSKQEIKLIDVINTFSFSANDIFSGYLLHVISK